MTDMDEMRTAERLAALIRLAPVGIAEMDAVGALITCNERYLALNGLTLEQCQGYGYAAAIHPDDAERIMVEWTAHSAAGESYETTVRLVRPDGGITWVQSFTAPQITDGVITGHLGAVADVTALHDAQVAASTAEARFRSAFEASPLGMALVAANGRIADANRTLLELSGCADLTDVLVEALFEDDAEPSRRLLDPRRRERRLLREDGVEVWVQITVAELHHNGTGPELLYELEDVTARRQAEAKIEHLALHDPLTQLPNRLLLLDRLRQALLQATRHDWGVGVLFLDLDRFKAVNDGQGHQAGDQVLAEVARRLRWCARQSDTVARLGGDEFVVICPEVATKHELLGIAASLRAALVAPIEIGNQLTYVDASIGLALSDGHDDPDALLRNADQAMYLAKDRGRGRHELYDEALRLQVQHRVDTEQALRGAVERDEIEVWFQPIVDLTVSEVVAHESLVRWRRPGRDLVLPRDFVGVSEEIGLIGEIGSTVLEQACLTAASLPEGIAISVNVSARQFLTDNLTAVVDRALQRSGLDPSRLWLELTESALVEAVDSAARTLQGLRSRGVRLAIDDFGSGYSSFEHLRAFSVDLLKIDMTFIRDVGRSPRDFAIVEGILRLGRSLGLDVVAEGIETAAQHDLLRELGCRYGQGYLFSEPVPVPQQLLALHLPQARRGSAEVPVRL